MVRPVTDQDIGLKVLRDPPADTADIDIVAIHGIGAHPDDTWCKRVGPAESPQRVNWLQAEDMLPAIAPHARIMRYGYQSEWFGEGAMRQQASTVAQRLLLALRRRREEYPHRPLIFIAHCFGGLVVLKALINARHDESEWAGIFASTTGLIFLGTPFRGAEGMSQMEMLAAAQREYQQDEIQPEVLKILEPGNEFLQEIVDQFGKTRMQANKAQVACFYELKSSNVGRIVGKIKRTRFIVSESSGCLDLSDATRKYSLSRTHFDMNKFGKNTEEDFEIVSDVIKTMIKTSMPRSFVQQSTLGTKRHCPQSIQIRDNKRARLGHQSNGYRNVCYGCHKTGHWRRYCPDRSEDTCYTCGKKGHWSEDCPKTLHAYEDRDEELDDSEVDDDEDMDSDSESEDEFGEGWAGGFGWSMFESLSQS